MHNLYFIENDNHELINNSIKKLISSTEYQNQDIIKYDLSEKSIDLLIQELDTYSFFQTKKIVLGYNATFLTNEKSDIEQNVDLLKKYIECPHPDNILIISCSKLDGKKKICQLIKEKFEFINVNIEPYDYIKEKLKDYKIDNLTINYFLKLTGDNLERINNEINKLINYLDDKKVITINDLDEIIIPVSDNNIFDLMDALVKKDKKRSFKLYNDLINNKVEVLKILINLSYQFRLMYQVKVLKNKDDTEIANILGVKNPKQIKVMRYKMMEYSEKELLNNLYNLAILDENIKTFKVIDTIAFPLYIANL